MGTVTTIADGLRNVLAGIGTWRDKATYARYYGEPLSDEELRNAYRYAWLPRKIVDLPALDAVREWRTWDSDKVAGAERKLGVQRAVLKAYTSARLMGYAGIYIGTNRSNVGQPLSDGETIRSLTVVTKDNLSVASWSNDATAEDFGQPEMYSISTTHVHPSRIVLLTGASVEESQVLGDSVLQAPYEALRNADSVAANIASLVFEAKIDVIKIKGLMANLGSQAYQDKLMERLRVAALGKSTNNALVMDADEDYQQKQINFGTLNELLMNGYQIAAGASYIPMTRLIGRAASGLNASGDNEISDYYDTIRSHQTLMIEPAMAKLDALLARNAGAPNATYEWDSLWQLDDKEQAQVNLNNANAAESLAKSGIFDPDALAKPVADWFHAPELAEAPDPDADDGKAAAL